LVVNKCDEQTLIPTIFSKASNGERVEKLSIAVEGTFMRMSDFLLPHNTAGCVCRSQIGKWCNTCSLHSPSPLDNRTLGAAILHQVLSETWGYPIADKISLITSWGTQMKRVEYYCSKGLNSMAISHFLTNWFNKMEPYTQLAQVHVIDLAFSHVATGVTL
jgi:hypothetical protein